MDKADDYLSLIVAVLAVVYSIFTVLRSIFSKDAAPSYGRDSDFEEDEDDDEFEKVVEPVKKKAPVRVPVIPKQAMSVAKKQENFEFHAKLDDYTQTTAIDDRHLEIHLRPGSELCSDAFRLAQSEGSVMVRPAKPTIQQLIKSLPQEKLLFLSYEVFHVPVSKRSSPFPWNG